MRTWWVEGSCRLVTAHPDTPAHQPAAVFDLTAVEDSVRALDLSFVTADFAPRKDGRWRIVDGQVSDRPRSTAAAALIAALHTEDR